MAEFPKPYQRFKDANAAVVRAYEALAEVCGIAGSLDAKSRELIKLGMAIGARLGGTVHAHARRARAAGGRPEEIRHIVALAVPPPGLPTTVAAFMWVEDVLGRDAKKRMRA